MSMTQQVPLKGPWPRGRSTLEKGHPEGSVAVHEVVLEHVAMDKPMTERVHPWRDCGRGVMEKLKNLRMNVRWLLSFILLYLEIQNINFESDQVDEVLQTILEETSLMLE
ncbi:unnamed protein product [Bubo scandiacus]